MYQIINDMVWTEDPTGSLAGTGIVEWVLPLKSMDIGLLRVGYRTLGPVCYHV